MSKLTPRLEAIVRLVTEQSGGEVIDVGSDHALLPLALLQNGFDAKITVTDIHAAPLENARAFLEKSGFEEKSGALEFVLADGLDTVDFGENACIVIAGMGGETIADILSRVKNRERMDSAALVLQPMTRQERLRLFLAENGFDIIEEVYLRENPLGKSRCYAVILAKFAKHGGFDKQSISLTEAFVGAARFPKPRWYLNSRLMKARKRSAGSALYSEVVNGIEGMLK